MSVFIGAPNGKQTSDETGGETGRKFQKVKKTIYDVASSLVGDDYPRPTLTLLDFLGVKVNESGIDFDDDDALKTYAADHINTPFKAAIAGTSGGTFVIQQIKKLIKLSKGKSRRDEACAQALKLASDSDDDNISTVQDKRNVYIDELSNAVNAQIAAAIAESAPIEEEKKTLAKHQLGHKHYNNWDKESQLRAAILTAMDDQTSGNVTGPEIAAIRTIVDSRIADENAVETSLKNDPRNHSSAAAIGRTSVITTKINRNIAELRIILAQLSKPNGVLRENVIKAVDKIVDPAHKVLMDHAAANDQNIDHYRSPPPQAITSPRPPKSEGRKAKSDISISDLYVTYKKALEVLKHGLAHSDIPDDPKSAYLSNVSGHAVMNAAALISAAAAIHNKHKEDGSGDLQTVPDANGRFENISHTSLRLTGFKKPMIPKNLAGSSGIADVADGAAGIPSTSQAADGILDTHGAPSGSGFGLGGRTGGGEMWSPAQDGQGHDYPGRSRELSSALPAQGGRILDEDDEDEDEDDVMEEAPAQPPPKDKGKGKASEVGLPRRSLRGNR